MVLVPIRADNAYVGFGLQSSQGTAVAPTVFPRWLDASLEFDLKSEEVWEGDGSRRLAMLQKNQQSAKVKMNFNPRPVEMGFFEKACLGSGADTVTAATLSTTTTTAITAATTATVTLTSVSGLGGSGTQAMVLEPGTANEEIAIFNLPASGSVLTLNAAYNNGTGKFAKSHLSGVTIATPTTHTLTDQSDGAYYTIEVCLGGLSGGAGPTLRIRDCKVETLKIAGKAGSLITYETEWQGIATVSTGSPATVTLEAHNPFLYTQGTWTLDGSAGGDALNVEQFDIQRKNNLDPVQTEQVTLAAIIFGNVMMDVAITVVFVNANLLNLTYFGGTSGTTDAQAIGSGSLLLVFTQADTFHSVSYNLPTLHYSKTTPPVPKKDGKHFTLPLSAAAVSNQGASTYLMQTILQNAQTAAY